jgi:hypothetical protein
MAKYGIHEVAEVTFYDLATNKPALILDSLKLSNFTTAASQSHASGGQGNARLLTWDTDRTAQYECQDALVDPKALAALAGNALVTGATTIHKKELLTAVAGTTGKTKVVATQTPLAGTVTIFEAVDGDNLGDEITSATLSTNEVSVDDTDLAVGAKAWVFYQYTSGATAQTITISADKFPGFYKVVGDTVIRNENTGVDEPFQIVIYKAKLMPGFELTMQASGDPSIFNFSLECYKPADKDEMVDFIKY